MRSGRRSQTPTAEEKQRKERKKINNESQNNNVTRTQINPRMRPLDVPRENQPRIRRPRRAREVYQINLRKPVHQRERVSKFSPHGDRKVLQ